MARVHRKEWNRFSKYHYLSHYHHPAAECYGLFIDKELAGFCSVLHFPHPILKNLKRVHRLVIHPDYQGLGIGLRLLNDVAKLYIPKFKFGIITSSPPLILSLSNSPDWVLIDQGRKVSTGGKIHGSKRSKTSDSRYRYTTSWRFKR